MSAHAHTDKQEMFEELFNVFLSFANESLGGRAVLAFYAPTALVALHPEGSVALNGKVLERQALDDQHYALTFEAVDRFERENPNPALVDRPRIFEAKIVQSDDETHERSVVWFECQEVSTKGPVCVATGWEYHRGRWLIAWMTVAESPSTWSFEQGRMMAAGDAAYIEGSRFLTPRTWLDLGWYRVHGHRKPALNIMPGARFACQNSTKCCRIGFEVEVPAHAQHVIDSIPWEQHAPHLKGTQLPAGKDGQLILKSPDETCRFLDEKGHCRIHHIFGRAIFRVCAVYPIFFKDTPAGVDVYGSQTCGSFRDGLGPLLEERHEDLYSRLALTPKDLSNTHYFIDSSEEPSDWARFQTIEKALLELLAEGALPLSERLWRGCLLFDGKGEGANKNYPPLPCDVAEPLLTEWRETLQILTSNFIRDYPSPEEGRPVLFPQETKILADMSTKLLISKEVSQSYGLRTAHHVNVLLYHLVSKTIALVAPKEQPLPSAGWWYIASAIQHRKVLTHILSTSSILEWVRRNDLAAYLLSDTA